jgi:hypothetical protein
VETREGLSAFDTSLLSMTVFEQMASDLASVFDEFAKNITVGNTAYRALVAEPDIALELESGGFNSTGNFTVKMLRSDWLQAGLAVGGHMIFDGQNYRVIRLVSRPPHPLVILTIEPT